MEAHVRTPEPLNGKGQLSNNWRMWKEDFIIFMKASGFIKRSQDEKAYLLLNLIGDVGREAYQKFIFENPKDKENMDILLQKFDEEFDPPKSEVQERYTFFTKSKRNNESIEAFIADLQELAKHCNFGHLEDSLVRDKVILDTKDRILRRKYLDEKDLNLAKIIRIYNDYEITTEKMKEISNQANQHNDPSTSKNQKPLNKPCCWRCGKTHPQGNCPAWGKTCNKCNEKHHFPQCCKSYIKKGDAAGSEKLKVNEDKNINNQWSKPDTKANHPFDQLKKATKMENTDSWVHVNPNTANPGASYSARSGTTPKRNVTTHNATKYNATTAAQGPVKVSLPKNNAATYYVDGGNQVQYEYYDNKTHYRHQGNQRKQNQRQKQDEPECVIS